MKLEAPKMGYKAPRWLQKSINERVKWLRIPRGVVMKPEVV